MPHAAHLSSEIHPIRDLLDIQQVEQAQPQTPAQMQAQIQTQVQTQIQAQPQSPLTLAAQEASQELEATRLAALRELAILDTAPESPYDTITWMAASWMHSKTASLAFVDETRIWAKATSANFPGLDQTAKKSWLRVRRLWCSI